MRRVETRAVLVGVGRRIAELRAARGLTQEQLLPLLGLTDVKHLQKIEAGRLNLTVRSLVGIASALGCESVASLFVEPASREVRRGRPRKARPPEA